MTIAGRNRRSDQHNPLSRVLNQKYDAIVKQCKQRRTLFEDHEFPANRRSISVRDPPEAVTQVDFQWKRPSEMSRKPMFVADGISRCDVQQGNVGNCWFVATLACLTCNRALFDKVVPPGQSFSSPDYVGAFRFHFWYQGDWIEVVVDDRLPTKKNNLVFVCSKDIDEYWSALLEKAYAKMYGCYDNMASGQSTEAMCDFTSGISEIISKAKFGESQLLSIMTQATEHGSLIGCGFSGQGMEHRMENGLITNHQYSVTGVDSVNGEQIIRVRNPWGEKEWNGPYSDGSREWQRVSERDKKRLGLAFKEDGEFWMPYREFYKLLSTIEVCSVGPEAFDSLSSKKRPKKWICICEHGEWIPRASAGGSDVNTDWYFTNPQYRVTLTESDDGDTMSTLLLSLALKNRRKNYDKKSRWLNVGYAIYKFNGDPNNNCPMDKEFFKNNKPLNAPIPFSFGRENSARHRLAPGTYVIVPSTLDAHIPGEFMLRMFTEKTCIESEMDDDNGFIEEGLPDEFHGDEEHAPEPEPETDYPDDDGGQDDQPPPAVGFFASGGQTKWGHISDFKTRAERGWGTPKLGPPSKSGRSPQGDDVMQQSFGQQTYSAPRAIDDVMEESKAGQLQDWRSRALGNKHQQGHGVGGEEGEEPAPRRGFRRCDNIPMSQEQKEAWQKAKPGHDLDGKKLLAGCMIYRGTADGQRSWTTGEDEYRANRAREKAERDRQEAERRRRQQMLEQQQSDEMKRAYKSYTYSAPSSYNKSPSADVMEKSTAGTLDDVMEESKAGQLQDWRSRALGKKHQQGHGVGGEEKEEPAPRRGFRRCDNIPMSQEQKEAWQKAKPGHDLDGKKLLAGCMIYRGTADGQRSWTTGEDEYRANRAREKAERDRQEAERRRRQQVLEQQQSDEMKRAYKSYTYSAPSSYNKSPCADVMEKSTAGTLEDWRSRALSYNSDQQGGTGGEDGEEQAPRRRGFRRCDNIPMSREQKEAWSKAKPGHDLEGNKLLSGWMIYRGTADGQRSWTTGEDEYRANRAREQAERDRQEAERKQRQAMLEQQQNEEMEQSHAGYMYSVRPSKQSPRNDVMQQAKAEQQYEHPYLNKDLTDEEKRDRRLKEGFQMMAGEDMELDAYELKEVLNVAFKQIQDECFSVDVCRSMIAMHDGDMSGKLGFEEFRTLYNDLRKWRSVFKKFDFNKNGTLSSYELRAALRSSGFRVSNKCLAALIMRYCNREGELTFSEFVVCAIRLKTMILTFKNLSKSGKEVELNINQFVETSMYS